MTPIPHATYPALENDNFGATAFSEHILKSYFFSPSLHVATMPSPSTGTITTGESLTEEQTVQLIDTAATFVTDGVVAGDIAYNSTDSSFAIVKTVSGETTLITTKLMGGSDNNWGTGDSYAIKTAPRQMVYLDTDDATNGFDAGLYYRNSANTAWVAVANPTSALEFKVGPSGSGANFAYTTDGTADDVQWQAALDAAKVVFDAGAPAKVTILPGNYSFAAAVEYHAGVEVELQRPVITPASDITAFKNSGQGGTTTGYYHHGSAFWVGTNVTSDSNDFYQLVNGEQFFFDVDNNFKDSLGRGMQIKQSRYGYTGRIYYDNTHDPLLILGNVTDSLTSRHIRFGLITGQSSISDGVNVRSSSYISGVAHGVANQRNGGLYSSVQFCYFTIVTRNNNQEAVSDFHAVGVNKASGGVISKGNFFDVVAIDDQATPTQTTGINFTVDCEDNFYRIRGSGSINGNVVDLGKRNTNVDEQAGFSGKTHRLDIVQGVGTDNTKKAFLGNDQSQQVTLIEENPTHISIYLSKSNAGGGDLSLRLYEWDTNYATTVGNSPVARDVILAADISSTTWYHFDIAKSLGGKRLDPTKQYFIRMEGSSGDSTDNYRIFRSSTDVYASNDMYVDGDGSTSTVNASNDMKFVTHYADPYEADDRERDSKEYVYAKNISGATVNKGEVGIISATGSNGDEIDTTTVRGNHQGHCVSMGEIETNTFGWWQTRGKTKVNVKVDGTDDIAVGDLLGTFTTVGIAAKSQIGEYSFLISLGTYTTDDSNGTIDCLIIGVRQVPTHSGGSFFRLKQGQITTTDATPTAVTDAAIDIPFNTFVVILSFACVLDSIESMRGGFLQTGFFYRKGSGNVAQQGTNTDIAESETNATDYELTINTTDQTVEPIVTGLAASTLKWQVMNLYMVFDNS